MLEVVMHVESMDISRMNVPRIKKGMRSRAMSKSKEDKTNVSLWELSSAMLVMLLQTLMDGGLIPVQPVILPRPIIT